MNLLRYFVVAVVAATAALYFYDRPELRPVSQAEASPMISNEMPTLAPMLKRVLPGVVNISITTKVELQNPLMQDPFFRRFFGVPEQQQPQSSEPQTVGSGVIVDAGEGYVLTNHHVVAQADKVFVNLSDSSQIEAKVIGSDPETDIAVLKINPKEASSLTALVLADSDNLEVGDFVVAVGNPFALGQTVTSGIVSALGRVTGGEGYQDFIQTDAAINPGNSGGALINLRGELVGINSQILSRTGGNIGIGFAIPTNLAKTVMDQLIEYGDVKRGKIGIVGQPLTAALAKEFGAPDAHGAVVTQVLEDSPADKAGIKVGDVIVTADGHDVRDMINLRNIIGLKRIGDKVELGILRDKRQRSLTVKIGADDEGASTGSDLNPFLAGASFGPVAENHPLAGQVKGVQVNGVAPGSAAARAGLRPGDIVTAVNRRDIGNMKDFEKAVAGKGQLLLHVRRGNGALFILIQ